MTERTEQELLDILSDTDIDMFVQAQAMHILCSKHGYTQSSLAQRLGVSQSCIGNKTRLLQYSESERNLIQEHRLTERHARALLRAKPPKREKLIATVGSMQLTVRQTEDLIARFAQTQPNAVLSHQPMNIDAFTQQTRVNAQRLCALGYKTTCMIESGESWRRITITILE